MYDLQDLAEPTSCGSSGEPRPDFRHGPGQRPRHGMLGLYYFDDEQKALCESSGSVRKALQSAGKGHGGEITTEIRAAADFEADGGKVFYYAEDDHQQYLAKPARGHLLCTAAGVASAARGVDASRTAS